MSERRDRPPPDDPSRTEIIRDPLNDTAHEPPIEEEVEADMPTEVGSFSEESPTPVADSSDLTKTTPSMTPQKARGRSSPPPPPQGEPRAKRPVPKPARPLPRESLADRSVGSSGPHTAAQENPPRSRRASAWNKKRGVPKLEPIQKPKPPSLSDVAVGYTENPPSEEHPTQHALKVRVDLSEKTPPPEPRVAAAGPIDSTPWVHTRTEPGTATEIKQRGAATPSDIPERPTVPQLATPNRIQRAIAWVKKLFR